MYPMDFYANDSLGDWTPNHKPSGKTGTDVVVQSIDIT